MNDRFFHAASPNWAGALVRPTDIDICDDIVMVGDGIMLDQPVAHHLREREPAAAQSISVGGENDVLYSRAAIQELVGFGQ